MKYLHATHSASRGSRSKNVARRQAFTTVELVVSIGIFMVVATFVTVIIARSLGEGARIQQARAASAAASDALNALMTNSYASIVGGDFTVPFACPETATGIAGVSCVTKSGGQQLRITYSFTGADDQCPLPDAEGALTAVASPPAEALERGSVGVCAFPMRDSTEVNTDAVVAKEFKNAPWAGYSPSSSNDSLIVVDVAGQQAGLLESSVMYLVRESDPTLTQATATVSDSVARFEINSQNTCTQQSPCQVALEPSSSPATKSSAAIFGPAARPGANVVATPGQVTQVSVTADAAVSAQVRVEAAGGQGAPAGVQVWGYVTADPGSEQSALTDSSSVATFTTYEHAATGARYPLGQGESFTVGIDPDSGVCQDVCTSWTWGTANLSSPVTFPAGERTPVVRFDASSPASVSQWATPRVDPACAQTQSCAPVVVNPEDELCPGELCLAGG